MGAAASVTAKASVTRRVDLSNFTPATEYAGRREGFVFKNGEWGLGYYRDTDDGVADERMDTRRGVGWVEMLRRVDWCDAFAQPGATLDSLLDARDELPALRDDLDREIDRRLVQGPGALPLEARMLLNGSYSDVEVHMLLIRRTARYVVEAVPYSHASKLVKANVRRVLGTESFTLNMGIADAWDDLQDCIRARMHKLGAPLDEMFRKLHLASQLGQYDPQIAVPAAATEATSADELLVQLVPTACTAEHFSGVDVASHDDLECTYIHFVRLLALALDEAFQHRVNAVLKDVGVRLVGGGVSSGGVKGYDRMRNKMLAPEDHGRLSRPRPAHNIDVVRCLATFRTVGDMLTGFEAVRLHVFSGGYVKFKNGMRWEHAEAASRFHLRVVLGTGSFVHPVCRKMGELRSDPGVQRLWGSYLEKQGVPISVARGTWKRHVQVALRWLDEMPAEQEVSMLCEVQMLLREYTAARTGMHELYKIVRADTAKRLLADFAKFGAQHKADRAHEICGNTELRMALRDGSVDALKRLLAERDAREATHVQAALEITCAYAHPECVEHILASRQVLSSEQLDSALRHAPLSECLQDSNALGDRRAAVTRLLVQAKGNVNSASIKHGSRPAWMGFQEGHASFIEELIRLKANPHKARLDPTESTPALAAALDTHFAVLRSMMKRGSVPGEADGELMMASRDGALDALKRSLAGCDARETKAVATALIVGCTYAHPECVELTLASGPVLSREQLSVALVHAAQGQCRRDSFALDEARVVVARLLVQAKADVDYCVEGHATPVSMAAQSGRADMLQALVQLKADVCKDEGPTPTVLAAKDAHVDVLQVLLQAKADMDKGDNKGNTAAATAASYGHVDVVHMLAQAKADVAKANSDDFTPIRLASSRGHVDVVWVLAYAKVDVDAATKDDGATPMCVAALDGHVDVLRVLLRAKADMEKASADGRTPAIFAAAHGHAEALQLLVHAKVDVDKATGPRGSNCCHWAAEGGHADVMRVLVQAKANVDKASTYFGITPTYIAAQNGHDNVLQVLLHAKADAQKATTNGGTPAGAALTHGHIATVKMLGHFSLGVSFSDDDVRSFSERFR
jgi:ankyrin repeat protein